MSNADLRSDRTLESILHILVESYQQNAAQSSLVIRDSDLRAGERYVSGLGDKTIRDPFYLELILGTVGTIGLQTLIDKLPQSVLSQSGKLWAIGGVLVAILVFLILRWVLHWQPRTSSQAHLSRNLLEVSDAYSTHSARSVRLQREKQARVALEAVLLPIRGRAWHEIARTGQLREVRDNLDDIADADRVIARDELEYNRQGGDYWLELLQATLRGWVPGFICSYLAAALRSDQAPGSREGRYRAWRRDAVRLCAALHQADKRLSTVGDARQELQGTIETTNGFTQEGLLRLLAACNRHPYDYPGPRTLPPREFFAAAFPKTNASASISGDADADTCSDTGPPSEQLDYAVERSTIE